MNSYTSIYDCPAWNWIRSAGDHRYLLILQSYAVLPSGDFPELAAVYDAIYDEYLTQFGLTETEHYLLNLHRDSLELKLDLMDTGNSMLITQIKLLDKKIDEAKGNQSDETDIFEVAAVLSKHFGYDISPLKLSVVEFFSKLKLYEKEIIALSAKGRGGNG